MDLKRLMKYANLIIWVIFFINVYKKIGIIGTGMLCASLILYYSIYYFFVSNSNIIITKMVSSRIKRGFDDNAKKIFSYYLYYILGISAIFIIIFSILSNFICRVLYKNIFLAPIIATSFILFVISGICDAIKSYYNGIGDNIFVFISDVVKDIALIVSSFFFINSFVEYGNKVAALKNNSNVSGIYGAIGVIILLIIIRILVFIVLLCGIGKVFKKDAFSFNEVRSKDGFKSFLKAFLPANTKKLTNSLFPLLSCLIISIILIRRNYNIDTRTTNDSVYTTISYLISFLILIVIAIKILKEISSVHILHIKNISKKEDRKSIIASYTSYVNTMMVIAIPLFITFICYLKSIYEKLFMISTDDLLAIAIIASLIFLFSSIDTFSSCGLEALSLESNKFIGSVLAFVIQIIFIVIATKKDMSAVSILVSFLLFYIFSAVIHAYYVIRDVGIKYNDFIYKIIKIGIAGIPMLIIDIILANFLTMNIAIIGISIIIGYLIYFIVFAFVKGITRKELVNYEGTISYYFLNILSNLLGTK